MLFIVFVIIILQPPRSTRTVTLFPNTPLFRSRTAKPPPRAPTFIRPSPTILLPCWKRGHGLGRRNGRTAPAFHFAIAGPPIRSEEHTSELQSLMSISYAVFCLKKKTQRLTLSILYTLRTHESCYKTILTF